MTEAHITLDFETRSEVDLKTAGAWLYSLHPSTEVLCMAFKAGKAPVKLITPKDFRFLRPKNTVWGDYFTYEAHNANFEFAIWHNQMCKKYNWPKIPIERWFCSATKAASHGLPRSLEGAAEAMNLPVKKDMSGHRIMLKMSKPRSKWRKTGEGPKWFEDESELEQLYKYCMNDVETEYALSSTLDALSDQERKVWALDQVINRRGISCDLELIQAAIKMISILEGDAQDEIFDLTNGEISTLGQVAKILEYIHKNYPQYKDLENLQADTIEQFLKDNIHLPSTLKRILELRQLHSKASTRKYKAMLNRADSTGRIRDTLLYHGAHTGRWSGVGIQPQNYYKSKYPKSIIEEIAIPAIKADDTADLELNFESPMDALASSLRASLCAAPGKVLIGADYSAIEARVLLWLVDDKKALELIKTGGDIYKDMASKIYAIPIHEITDEQREMGKRAILGLGYQMGPKKFKDTCWDWGKVEVSLNFAKRVIDIYRTRYSGIVDYWYTVNDYALSTVQHKKQNPNKFFNNRVYFSYKPPFLYCHLPSGRKLAYKDPELYMGKFDNVSLRYCGVNSVTKKWEKINTYGGKLTENIVQAVARDIMAEGMLRAENSGFPIVLTVHDEVIAEVSKGSIDEFVSLLTELPKWADGCPIEAKGWKGKRYRK